MGQAQPGPILLVDPSLFTAPYDCALARALMQKQQAVALVTRPLRSSEDILGTDIQMHRLFYRRTGTLPRPLRLPIRIAEHWAGLARLVHLVEAVRPSVVHFQWSNEPPADLWAIHRIRRRCPVVFTLHDSALLECGPLERLRRWGLSSVLAAADAVIVHTQEALRRLDDHPGAARVPHGILRINDAPIIRHPRRPGAPIRLTLFGRLKTYKGIDTLVEALGLLPPVLRDKLRVVIAGEPHIDVAALQRRIETLALDSVVSLRPHYVTDSALVHLLEETDVALFPYRRIDASGAYFLALSARVPVIASQEGIFGETIGDWGNGLLVPPDDAELLSAAIQRLLCQEGLLDRLTAAAGKVNLGQHDWAVVAAATLEAYARAEMRHRDSRGTAGRNLPQSAGSSQNMKRVNSELENL